MASGSEIAPEVRTMRASKFKDECLKLLDEVARSGGEIVITKNGKPVSKLVPYDVKPKMAFGRHRDSINITGDIVSPMPTEWFEDNGAGDDLL